MKCPNCETVYYIDNIHKYPQAFETRCPGCGYIDPALEEAKIEQASEEIAPEQKPQVAATKKQATVIKGITFPKINAAKAGIGKNKMHTLHLTRKDINTILAALQYCSLSDKVGRKLSYSPVCDTIADKITIQLD